MIKMAEEDYSKREGIIIPESARQRPLQGEVVAVGPGRISKKGKRIGLELKKGDKVLVGRYSGTNVTIEDQSFILLAEDEVLAIME